MFLGFGKKISQVVANQSKSSNLLRQPKNIQQILRLLTTYLNHKYSTFEQEQKTELVSDYDFIVSRIEENPNQEQDLVRQENYEIIFPEDSKEIPYNDVRYMHNYMNKVIEYVTVEEHLEDLLFYMREDIAQQNSQNKSNQHSNSTNTDQTSSSTQKQQQENHHKNEAHFTPRYQGKTAEERKVVFFNTNSKKIAKNCTPQLINQLIQATELFYTLPNALKGIYKRKFTQMYKMIFYNDISMSIPLPQMRKILFFAVCHNIQLNNIIAVRYFAHHKLSDIFEVPTQEFYPILSNNNNSDHIKDKEEPTDNNINDIEKKLFKLSKTNENELKFDNLIDLIIYIYILKDKTIRISNAYIHENALQNIESIMKAIKSKQFQFKFKSFLMLYSQLVQLYAEQPEQQRIENKRLKTIIEETSQIIFLILHQVQFAEQKLEILLLFTLAQEKEKVDFYLPVVQDHIKQNIDNLNLSDEFLRIICNHISFLKSTHELSYNYFMNILFEQPTLSNSCVTAILKSDNNIALDLPFKLKKKMLQVVDSDSVNAKSMSSFFTTPFSGKDGLYVHPSLRFQLGFQQKLMTFTKLFNYIHIENSSFIRLIRDIEEYDHQVLCEDLSFKGITSLFLALNKLRMLDSPIFPNFEDHIINLLENHAFEKTQLWLAVVIVYSYSLSTHMLSQRFIETSMIFLCYNMNRLEPNRHEYVYKYLTILMMKLHNKDYGPFLTFASAVRPNFGIILHELNKMNVFDVIREMKINPMIVKAFYHTLKIVAPEQFEKSKVAKQILELEKYGVQGKKDKLSETAFSQEIQYLLDELNIKYEKEKRILFYHVDFYLPKYNLILEANGPSHYILNTEIFTENYRLKKFHLQNEGYQIYDISYDKLANSEIEQKPKILEEIKADLTKYLLKFK